MGPSSIGVLPMYFISEWSVAPFRLPKDLNISLEVLTSAALSTLASCYSLQKLVLELLKKLFGIDHDKSNVSSEKIYPKWQLELNVIRLAGVFSDDSNFRSFFVINFTEALAAIFLFSHGEFLSSWCSSALPVCEDDGTLDIPRASYAHQRTSLLIQMIANLHCYVPDVCQGSLLSHAEPLVPRFLNEDDGQLLRFFIHQFESLILPAPCEDNQGKVALNHDNGSSDMSECMVKNITTLEVDRIDAKGTKMINLLTGKGNLGLRNRVNQVGPL